MLNYSLLLATIGAILAYHAWREHAQDNRRDGRLLGAFALATMAGSASLLVA